FGRGLVSKAWSLAMFLMHPGQWRDAWRRKVAAWKNGWLEFKGTFRQFFSIAKLYWISEKKYQALGLLGLLIAGLAAVNYLNVTINHVAGGFQTALATKNAPAFWPLFWQYFHVFVIGTPIVVMYQWFQDKLGMHWRDWLTRHLLDKYFANRAY